MDIVASMGLAHSEHLGPPYSDAENPGVDSSELLPNCAKLNLVNTPMIFSYRFCGGFYIQCPLIQIQDSFTYRSSISAEVLSGAQIGGQKEQAASLLDNTS